MLAPFLEFCAAAAFSTTLSSFWYALNTIIITIIIMIRSMISPWGVYYITGVECNKLGTSAHTYGDFFMHHIFPPIVSFVAFLRLRFISNHLPSGAKARITHITILTYVIVTIHHATFNAMMLHLKGIFFSYTSQQKVIWWVRGWLSCLELIL